MAREINEILFSRHLEKKTTDPICDMEKIIGMLSHHGQVNFHREQNFHSLVDRRTEKSFELLKNTDGITALLFDFHAKTTKDSLTMMVSGRIRSFPGNNEIFSNFYMEHVYPRVFGSMKSHASKLIAEIESEMK